MARMKRKILSVIICLCMLTACGPTIEDNKNTDAENLSTADYIKESDAQEPEEQMPAADEEIYTEGPFIMPELSDPLMNPDPNERIDAYITTLWVNLDCDAEVPLCRISTERDVESTINYFGYDFREAVKGYSIEEFDYVVGCFGRGRSGYYSNKAGSVRYDGDYICIDDDEGYFCIAAIPKMFFEKHLVSTKTIQDIIDQDPKEQKIDAYIISISVDCVSNVGPSCFRISTEEDLEYAKAVFGNVFQGDLQKYSLEEYDYYVDFGGYNTPLSFDSVRYYEKNESIYFHERRSVYNGGSGYRSLGRIYMDVAAIPKSIFAEKDYGVCSIQEFQWIKDSLKNAQYLGVINDPNAIKE